MNKFLKNVISAFPTIATVLLTAATMTVTSCTDPVEPNDPKGKQATATAVIKGEGGSQEVYVSSANVVLTTEGCASYAYSVVEGEQAEAPLPEIIYAEAEETGFTANIETGSTEVKVKGLKGNTPYTVFFAFKTAEGYEKSKYETASVTLTTKSYTQVLTVLNADKFEFDFHVEIDADKYYRVVFMTNDMYHYFIDNHGYVDADYVKSGQMFQGSRDFHVVDGGYLCEEAMDKGNPEMIKPGTAFVLIVCECDEKGKLLCTFPFAEDPDVIEAPAVAKAANPNIGTYIENESDQPGVIYQGVFARQFFWTEAPDQGVGSFTVTQDKLTELSATFTITPDPSIEKWAAFITDTDDYASYVKWVGEDGILALLLANSQPFTGKMTLSVFDPADGRPMTPGKTFRLVLIGQEDKVGAVQVSKTIDFEPAVATTPAPKVEITAAEDPNNSPYMVWFNIKCTTKNLGSIKYICNYVPDWAGAFKAATIEEMMNAYGSYLTGAAIIDEINSDEGYNIGFSSWEHSESALWVAAYNEEDKCAYYSGNSWSTEEPDKERVESPLFTELLGDWTANFVANVGDKQYDYTYRVNIAGAPEQGPATLAEMDKKEYDLIYEYFYKQAEKKGQSTDKCEQYATDQITKLFAEYKELAAKYAAKYRGQNRLVVRGCGPMEVEQHYLSPWDLFCNIKYTAYNTEELFLDYGSKIFFEVRKDSQGNDMLVCDTNPAYIPAMVGWSENPFYWLGAYVKSETQSALNQSTFNIELSADKQTMTMKPEVVNGETYWPSIVQYMNGYYFPAYIAVKDVVFTKGWTEPAAAPALRTGTNRSEVNFTMGDGHRFMRARFTDIPESNIPVGELEQFDFATKYVAE